MSKEIYTQEYILKIFKEFFDEFRYLPKQSYWAHTGFFNEEGYSVELCSAETVKKKFGSVEEFLKRFGWAHEDIKGYLNNTGREIIQKGLNGIMKSKGQRS